MREREGEGERESRPDLAVRYNSMADRGGSVEPPWRSKSGLLRGKHPLQVILQSLG